MTRLPWPSYAVLSAAVATVLVASPAHAETSLQMNASSRQAEVGQGIRIELHAMSDDDSEPNTPRLRVPPGFTVQGPSVSSSQSFSIGNGRMEHLHGIQASFIIVGTKPGQYVIGPGTVMVGKQLMQAQTLTVEIVPAGTMPKPKRPRSPFDPTDPFDPFSLLQRLPNFQGLDDLEDALPHEAQVPPEYLVDHASDPIAFVRPTVTPEHPVVGQQVSYRVYTYGGRNRYQDLGTTEPSRSDFVAYAVVDDSTHEPKYTVDIDGQKFIATKARETALFPLRAGQLTIGETQTEFGGPRYPQSQPGRGLVRKGVPLVIDVREPPMAGRPPGYEIGDVGRYSLSAEVEPRKVTAGDAIAVTLRLEGRGNVPNHLKLPERPGVEWLDPTTSEGIGPRDGVIAGFRQFRYVVRINNAGKVDLGEVTLPYYDAEAQKYAIARVSLGTVEVEAGAAPSPAASASAKAAAVLDEKARDPFEGLGGPRKKLEPFPPSHPELTDSRAFWAALGGGPVAVVLLAALAALAKALRARRGTRTESFATVARRAIADAEGAAKRGDAGAVAAGVEKAVYTTIEGKLGLKARAVMRERLAPELAKNGADEPLAKEVTAVLDACDSLRFANGDGGTASSAVVAQAAAVVSRLGKVSRAAPRERAQ